VEALNEESEEIAIYLIRRHTGLTNGEIGKIFKMKAQAVSKAGIKIVFSRADPLCFRQVSINYQMPSISFVHQKCGKTGGEI